MARVVECSDVLKVSENKQEIGRKLALTPEMKEEREARTVKVRT